MKNPIVTVSLIVGLLGGVTGAEVLPSWTDRDARDRIIAFVEGVTLAGSDAFVAEADRIAVFDNDGCLWAEQPMYFQAFYIFDRIREMAPGHPQWQTEEPFASVLKGDLDTALEGGAGLTADEFSDSVLR